MPAEIEVAIYPARVPVGAHGALATFAAAPLAIFPEFLQVVVGGGTRLLMSNGELMSTG